jgi:hypothetical protein
MSNFGRRASRPEGRFEREDAFRLAAHRHASAVNSRDVFYGQHQPVAE